MRIDVVNAKIRLGLRLLDLHQHAPGVLRQLCSGTRLSPSQLSSLLFASAAFGDQIYRRVTWKTLATSTNVSSIPGYIRTPSQKDPHRLPRNSVSTATTQTKRPSDRRQSPKSAQ